MDQIQKQALQVTKEIIVKFIEVGRIYLGPTTAPERNYRSWGREDIDNTAITPSYDGAESFESKSAYTTLAFEFERILPAPFDALVAAVRPELGDGRDVPRPRLLRPHGRVELSPGLRGP